MNLLQVRLDFAGIGLSFVAGHSEILYARLSGLELRATSTSVHYTVELCVRAVQV